MAAVLATKVHVHESVDHKENAPTMGKAEDPENQDISQPDKESASNAKAINTEVSAESETTTTASDGDDNKTVVSGVASNAVLEDITDAMSALTVDSKNKQEAADIAADLQKLSIKPTRTEKERDAADEDEEEEEKESNLFGVEDDNTSKLRMGLASRGPGQEWMRGTIGHMGGVDYEATCYHDVLGGKRRYDESPMPPKFYRGPAESEDTVGRQTTNWSGLNNLNKDDPTAVENKPLNIDVTYNQRGFSGGHCLVQTSDNWSNNSTLNTFTVPGSETTEPFFDIDELLGIVTDDEYSQKQQEEQLYQKLSYQIASAKANASANAHAKMLSEQRQQHMRRAINQRQHLDSTGQSPVPSPEYPNQNESPPPANQYHGYYGNNANVVAKQQGYKASSMSQMSMTSTSTQQGQGQTQYMFQARQTYQQLPPYPKGGMGVQGMTALPSYQQSQVPPQKQHQAPGYTSHGSPATAGSSSPARPASTSVPSPPMSHMSQGVPSPCSVYSMSHSSQGVPSPAESAYSMSSQGIPSPGSGYNVGSPQAISSVRQSSVSNTSTGVPSPYSQGAPSPQASVSSLPSEDSQYVFSPDDLEHLSDVISVIEKDSMDIRKQSSSGACQGPYSPPQHVGSPASVQGLVQPNITAASAPMMSANPALTTSSVPMVTTAVPVSTTSNPATIIIIAPQVQQQQGGKKLPKLAPKPASPQSVGGSVSGSPAQGQMGCGSPPSTMSAVKPAVATTTAGSFKPSQQDGVFKVPPVPGCSKQPPPRLNIGAPTPVTQFGSSLPPTPTTPGGTPQKLLIARRCVANMKSAEITAQDEDGDTYLHIAVCQKDPHLVKALLERITREDTLQVVMNMKNKMDQTALYLATVTRQPQVVEMLLSQGADPNLQARIVTNGTKSLESRGPLHVAAGCGDLATIQILLRNQWLNLDAKNSEGLTALHCAAAGHKKIDPETRQEIDSIDIITCLINRGAKMDVVDGKSGKTPLHYAIESKDVDLVKKMLEIKGSDQILKIKAFDENTCLHIAAGLQMPDVDTHKRMIRLLMNKGADPNEKNHEKNKPKDLVFNHNEEIVNILSGKPTARRMDPASQSYEMPQSVYSGGMQAPPPPTYYSCNVVAADTLGMNITPGMQQQHMMHPAMQHYGQHLEQQHFA
ncbi:uncharacterized protein LOC106181160 [Lingula anatina]|uniref:Uncharacterized protein LOC106181160 n=1 Tax=Lingula anatina TaxID=7574 RepID=A0A1S3KE59_LINAN|nr:uncharacterized protein LOC106181160 [Lingula anatina]|eukprot:XP_013420915.1 uncharacterized protein LOC106181160 [Lingula anatina]